MSLSIVVPVRNEPGFLDLCPLGISRCEGTRPEIVVADDGSSAETANAIAVIVRQRNAKLVVLDRHCGPSAARNRGFQAANGGVVVFMDSDDSEPSDPAYVSQYRNLLHSYIHHSSAGDAESFWTGCGSIRRDVFEAAGGFKEVYDRSSIEDVEFGVRLGASGRRIVLDPSIQVSHQKGWTLKSIIETDLLYRALPWTVLAWSGAGLPAKLNFTPARRVSVALTFAATILLLLSAFRFWLFPMAMLLFAIVTLSNAPLMNWLRRRKGIWFACLAGLLHWLHYFTSALGFLAGTAVAARILFAARSARQRRPSWIWVSKLRIRRRVCRRI
jgi:glycosyltransferase involved in cell wall biosynthesis